MADLEDPVEVPVVDSEDEDGPLLYEPGGAAKKEGKRGHILGACVGRPRPRKEWFNLPLIL